TVKDVTVFATFSLWMMSAPTPPPLSLSRSYTCRRIASTGAPGGSDQLKVGRIPDPEIVTFRAKGMTAAPAIVGVTAVAVSGPLKKCSVQAPAYAALAFQLDTNSFGDVVLPVQTRSRSKSPSVAIPVVPPG